VLGNIIHFASKRAHICVNPAKGWNFENLLNEAPPPPHLSLPHLIQHKMGMMIDGIEPRWYKNPRTEDITETHNPNEPVFLQLIVQKPGMEIIDSMEKHIPIDFI